MIEARLIGGVVDSASPVSGVTGMRKANQRVARAFLGVQRATPVVRAHSPAGNKVGAS